MTSIAPNNAATPPSVPLASASGVPQSSAANVPNSTASGNTSASASSQSSARSLSYAQATGKKTATIVSSPAVPAQHSSVTSPTGTSNSNARLSISGSSPVNGKPSIPPAVPPLVATPPAINTSGNATNGGPPSAGHHSRKSSVASQSQGASWNQQQNGLRMPPGQQPPTPSSIHFGSISQNVSNSPHTGPPISSPALNSTNPVMASAITDGLAISPQTSPSPAPQPAASGGPPPSLPRQAVMPVVFGSVAESNELNRSIPQRPISMPANGPLNANISGPPVHLRLDSAHGEVGPPNHTHNRNMQQNPPRRGQHQMGNNFGNQYQHHNSPGQYGNPGYSQNQQPYRNGPNQNRSGAGVPVGSPYQAPAHMANYQNNRGGRSPALTHSLPSTPQMGSAALAGNPPMQHSPHVAYSHLQPHMPPMQYQQGYEQYYQAQPGYIPYPQQQYMQTGSPRPHHTVPFQPQQGGFIPQYSPQPPSMSRTGSQMSEHHIARPPSSIPHMQHTPTFTPAVMAPPPLPHPGPTPSISTNNNSAAYIKRPERTSKKIEIRDPTTGTVRKFDNLPPVTTTSNKPVIVSSAPASDQAQHARSDSKSVPKINSSTKTDQEVKDEMKAAVQREIQAKKQQEEEEQRLKKEEEDRKAKEIEDARLKAEEEVKLAKEKEEREEREEKEREEAERQAAEEAKAKEKAEEEERLKREEEEAERKKKEEEELAERNRRETEEAEQAAKAKAEEEARLASEAAQEKARILAEEVQATDSPTPDTGVSTPAGPGDDDLDAKAVASAIKGSSTLSPDSHEANELASDIAKISVSAQPPSPTSEMPPPVKPNEKQRKPAPLNLQLKTSSEPALPSAALTALRSARFIDDINLISYPSAISSPNPSLNSSAPMGKFKYDKDFLMQFQTVFTEKPSIDWDVRMRDTVGEPDSARPISARVPSTAGVKGPRSSIPGPSTTGGMGMGSFGIGSKMGQPGNILATGRQPSNPFMQPGMGGMGGFRPPISRTGSSTQLSNQGNAPPQSPGGRTKAPRVQSKRNQSSAMDARQASQKGPRGDMEPTPITTIPASDVKPLAVSSTRWTPRSVASQAASGGGNASSGLAPASSTTAAAADDNRMPPEMVQRKVKAALNKMTPEKFDKIADQILEIASQSRYETDGRSLRQVIQLTFEKATDEPNFSSMYAKFCKRMLESMHPDIKDESIKDKMGNVVTSGALFRKYLLNRCQEEFERGWKVNLPPKPEGVSDETVMMSDEYYVAAAAKRRGLGLIQFIGELFKLQMLTERIMHECVKKLVDYEGTPEEEEVESLCKLLRTIGFALDATEKSRLAMDQYFVRIQHMMDSKDLNSRMKFMLLDVIELRKAQWESKEADKGPKTLAEIHLEAQKQQIEKDAAAARASQRQRPQIGRGDTRSFSQQGFGGLNQNQNYQDQRQNQIGSDELKRLGAKSIRQSTGGTSFGPATSFGRSGSGGGSRKGLGPGSTPLQNLFSSSIDSAATSRTTTPLSGQRDPVASTNSFSALSGHTDGVDAAEAHDVTSPPTDISSPPASKAKLPDTSTQSNEEQ